MTAAALYLGLMTKALCGALYEDPPIQTEWDPRTGYDAHYRYHGVDRPVHAPSMIGLARLEHLQWCVEQVLTDQVPGDLIETGVWRGGACILMRAVLAAHEVSDRTVWVADSFEGFPAEIAAAEGYGPDQSHLAVPLERVRANFERYGLLDDQVQFLPGWFSDTLPSAPIDQLSILRLDGDLFPSTLDALTYLYPKLAPGGFCIIDDWLQPGCKRAVTHFRQIKDIDEPIRPIAESVRQGDGLAISQYWRKR